MNEPRTEIAKGFRKTEIGLIPDEWEVARLEHEDAAETIMGQSPPSSTYNTDGVGLPFFQGKAEFGEVYPTATRWCSNPIKRAREGDILVSVRAPVGDVNMASSECCIGRGLAAIRPKGELDRFYLFNYLKLSKQRLAGEGTGTTFKEITKSKLGDYKIPLPPLSEQRKIAKVLSTIQRAIEQQDNIIAAARELKKSLVHHLFTYGPVTQEEAERVPLKETGIGEVPAHWEVATLGEVCKPRKETVQPTGTGNVRYVGLEHIDSGGIRLRRSGFDDEVRSAKSRFSPNDILYGKLRPYLDKAAIPEFEGMCSTDILVLRPNEDRTMPKFLVQLFHYEPFLSFASSTMTGTQHPRTSWLALSRFELGLPTLPEQHKIATILSTVDCKVDVEDERRTMLQELFKTMLYKLMTGQIRVKDIEV